MHIYTQKDCWVNISTGPGRCVGCKSVSKQNKSDFTVTKGNRYGFNDVFFQHEKQFFFVMRVFF